MAASGQKGLNNVFVYGICFEQVVVCLSLVSSFCEVTCRGVSYVLHLGTICCYTTSWTVQVHNKSNQCRSSLRANAYEMLTVR